MTVLQSTNDGSSRPNQAKGEYSPVRTTHIKNCSGADKDKLTTITGS